MNSSRPSRETFWRLLLLPTALLPVLAIAQLLVMAGALNVAVLASRSWMAVLAALAAFSLAALFTLISSWSRWRERVFDAIEFPARLGRAAILLLPVSLVAYPVFFLIPVVHDLLGGLGWVRALVFWVFSLAGMLPLSWWRSFKAWFICWSPSFPGSPPTRSPWDGPRPAVITIPPFSCPG